VKQKQNGDASKLTGIQTLRQRARQHIESGAVTDGYAADRDASCGS
jgi:bacterioferritin